MKVFSYSLPVADKVLFIVAALLITIGIVSSYTLSAYAVVYYGYDNLHFFLRQAGAGTVAILIMWFLAQLDPDRWLHPIGISMLILGTLLMIMMPFLPDTLAKAVGGAKRWIQLPGISIAPVEFFKVGFVYFLAWSFSRKFNGDNMHKITDEFKRFLPYAILFMIAVFLIAFLQNDLGQVVVLALTLSIMMLMAGSSIRFFGVLSTSALSLFAVVILTSENRINRIIAWWEGAQNTILLIFPESIAIHLRSANTEEPYQIGHSLNAIHHGGVFGTFLGNGTYKLGFLAEVHTDFVLAGIAEETGFVGVVFVVMSFLVLLLKLFKIAERSENAIYYLFSIGIGLILSLAFLINAYGISGILPIKGIAVPFLSYGGSSLIGTSIAIGMILMISRRAPMRK